MGLYQDRRPTSLDAMVGQQAAVSQLKNFLASKEVPHVLLFSGPSGVGKTTAARIIASSLSDSCKIDQVEKNAASDNGIDMVRDIEAKMRLKPLSGGVRVYIIDEVHAVSPQGQRALLKVLEDTPKHVYFIFCTSNPEKLEKPFLNRCTHVKFGEIAFPELVKLLESTAKALGLSLDSPARIAEAAGGSARQALVLLEQLSHTDKALWAEVLHDSTEVSPDLFQLVKDLYSGVKIFPKHAEAIKNLPEGEVERLRITILSYGATMLRSGSAASVKAAKVMSQFKEPFFSSKKSGFTLAIYLASA